MPRWESGGLRRLEQAALELFAERGFERTTVAEITRRAGLTERSFYRHFPDKREVLFAGGAELREHLLAELAQAPAGAPALQALLDAVRGAGAVFRPREDVRRRSAVITDSPALRERELVKLADLSTDLSAAVVGRGTDRETAALAVATAMAVMQLAVARWLADDDADYAAAVDHLAAEVAGLGGVDPLAPPARSEPLGRGAVGPA